jgi:hypothetical protein
VFLGEGHYYILSRFLISRSLTLTKIPGTKARTGPGRAAHSSARAEPLLALPAITLLFVVGCCQAVKLALELKKLLVDANRLSVTQVQPCGPQPMQNIVSQSNNPCNTTSVVGREDASRTTGCRPSRAWPTSLRDRRRALPPPRLQGATSSCTSGLPLRVL